MMKSDFEAMEATNNHPTPTARTCQYIAGGPSADDGCKCRRPAMPGPSFCEIHAELRRPQADETEMAT